MSNSAGMDLTFYLFLYQFLYLGNIETMSSTLAHAMYGNMKMHIQTKA